MQHLLGEHVECHMFLGSMIKGKSLEGYYRNGLFFGPGTLAKRHKELSEYIGGHNSPLRLSKTDKKFIRQNYPEVEITEALRLKALETLISRCSICKMNLDKSF